MKLTVTAVLYLSLLLFHIHFSLAKKKGLFGGKINLFKKTPKINTKQPKQPTQFNQGGYPHQPGSAGGYPNQGGYPRQPGSAGGYPNQGGYPPQPGSAGGYPNQGGYPYQPGSAGGYPNQGGYPYQPGSAGGYPNQGGYPYQPGSAGGYPNQGGYPYQPGRAGGYPNQGGYPHQPGRPGGYPNQGGYPQQPGYPAGGYPAGGYPAQGYSYGGVHGGYGSYGGGYVNQNPNNQILSPRYGNSFGYGGHGVGGGSPFSHSVQAMGAFPSDKSRGFGRRAAMAAAGGAVAGMAVGYGLGRFPRPHFDFHSPQEEYYYNHYMYRKYGVQSTDTNDYSRDYRYSNPPVTYDNFMNRCMKRTDLLPAENRQPDNKPAAATTNITTTTTTTAAPDTGTGSNATRSNSTAADNSSTSAPSTPRPLNESETNPVPPASQVLRETVTDKDADDDTVSIVEIGYPALIEQLKVRRCVGLYIVYSEKYLEKKTTPSTHNGVQGLEMSLQRLLTVVTSTTLMLLNSNMLMLLH